VRKKSENPRDGRKDGIVVLEIGAGEAAFKADQAELGTKGT
jgi:hypothetical protein